MATLKPQPVSEETRQAVANRVRATLAPLFDDITAVEFGHSADIYIVRLKNTRRVSDASWPRRVLTETQLYVVTNGTRSITVRVPAEWLAEASTRLLAIDDAIERGERVMNALFDAGLTPISINPDPESDRGDYLIHFVRVIADETTRAIDRDTAFAVVDSGDNWVSICVPRDWPPKDAPTSTEIAEPQAPLSVYGEGQGEGFDSRAARILDTLEAARLEPVSARCIDETGGIWRVEFRAVSLPIINIISGDKTPFQVSSSGGTWVNIRVFDDFWQDAPAAAEPAAQAKHEFAVGDTVITRTGHRGQIEVIVGGLARVKTANDCRNHALDTLRIAAPDPVVTDAEPKPETDPLPAFDGDTEQLPGIVIGNPADLPEFLITGAPEAGEPFAEEATDESTRTDEAAVPLSVYGEGQGEGFEDEPTDGLSLEEIFDQAGVVSVVDHEAEIERLRSQLETVQRERDAFEALLNAEFRPTVKQFHIERDTHPAQMEKLDREGWTLAHMQFEGDRLHTVWQREQPQPAAGDPERAAASAPLTDEEIWEIARNVTLEEHKVGEVFLNEHAAHAPTAERIIIDVKPVGTIPQNFTECFPITSLLIQHGPDAVLAAAHDGMMEVGRATFERLMSRPRPQRPPIFLTSGE